MGDYFHDNTEEPKRDRKRDDRDDHDWKEKKKKRDKGTMSNLSPLLLFCLVASAITFFLAQDEGKFFNHAAPAKAILSEKRLEQTLGITGEPRNKRGRRPDIAFNAAFTTAEGKPVLAKVETGTKTTLENGDKVDILYDPQNPERARLSQDQDNMAMMLNLSQFFAGSFCALFLFGLVKTKRREELKMGSPTLATLILSIIFLGNIAYIVNTQQKFKTLGCRSHPEQCSAQRVEGISLKECQKQRYVAYIYETKTCLVSTKRKTWWIF